MNEVNEVEKSQVDNNDCVPVALFAYARPDHLLETINGLRVNNVPLIYAFSDGPRSNDVIQKVSEVRRILHSIDWCEIEIIERETNHGLGVSIRTGVEYVLNIHDRVMVVEDDIVLHPGAYLFMKKALDFYKDDENIMSVSLWSHPRLIPKTKESVFFWHTFNCWGWGAYRRSWEGMDKTALELMKECQLKGINVNKYLNLEQMALNEHSQNIWAVRFSLLHQLKGKANVWPTQSLVRNIGCDGTGENSVKRRQSLNQKPGNSAINNNFPKFHKMNGSQSQFIKFYQGSLPKRKLKKIKGLIKKMLGSYFK